MDQVHVARHKVLVEGLSARRVAREMGISRILVKCYLGLLSEPGRVEESARSRVFLARQPMPAEWTCSHSVRL